MQKMPAPLALASALCHVATIAVIGNMYIQLSTLRDTPAGPHRTLLDSDSAHDPLAQTVARLEKAADAHGARLAAVEKGNAELTAILNEHIEGHEGTRHGGAHTPTAVAQQFQNLTGDNIHAQRYSLQQRDAELQASIQALSQERERRGLQDAEPEPGISRRNQLEDSEPESYAQLEQAVDALGARVTVVERLAANFTSSSSTQKDTQEGTEPSSRTRRTQTGGDHLHAPPIDAHAEPVYILKPNVARLVPVSSGGSAGHRRAQAGGGICSDLESRSAEVTQVCCDEPEEDCTGGYPHSCNAGCAATFLPFWEECRTALGKSSSNFEPVVELCTASAGTSGTASRPSLAEQLNLQCTDGTAAAECVPECSEAYHGYLMLLSIDGDDSKLSCELHHGYYSWVGAAVRASS